MNKHKIKNEKPYKTKIQTLNKENIARKYLMAKNIANNSRLIEQNAQYDIGTNIISKTPGNNNNREILLTDLQLITVNNANLKEDSDMDGITDGNELGTYKNVEISGLIRHMLKADGGKENADAL